MEHLQNSALGFVVSVLRAPAALRNPYRLALFQQGVAHVRRYFHGVAVEVVHRASAYNLEHLVHLADVNHNLALHQIAAEGDLRGAQMVGIEGDLQERGVQQYVSVVGDEHITMLLVKGLKTFPCETGTGSLHNAPYRVQHNLVLEFVNGGYLEKICLELLHIRIREEVSDYRVKKRIRGHSGDGCRNLIIEIGTGIFKHGFCMQVSACGCR